MVDNSFEYPEGWGLLLLPKNGKSEGVGGPICNSLRGGGTVKCTLHIATLVAICNVHFIIEWLGARLT